MNRTDAKVELQWNDVSAQLDGLERLRKQLEP